MSAPLPRSEAERTLDDLGQRARVGVAVAVAAFVVLARQTGRVPDDLLADGFVIASAFFVSVIAHEVPPRLATRGSALAAGVLADLAASSIAVALLVDHLPLAPIALLWPVFTAGLVASTLYVLGVAALATIVLFAIVLARQAGLPETFMAGGWGLLYFVTAFGYAEILREFRRAQRTTESALSHAASLSYCTSVDEVSETLFAFLDVVLGCDECPAVLLHDEAGVGTHGPVAARGIDPEVRARLRLVDEAGGDALGVVQDGGMWLDPKHVPERLALAGAFRDARRLFLLPLRDQRRVVGAVVVVPQRERKLSEEAQRGIARVSAQAAGALQRLRAGRLVEQQRVAMSFLLDVRRAGDDVGAVASWGSRAARDLTGASGAALVAREELGFRALAATELDPAELVEDGRAVLDAVFARRLPVVITDLGQDRRFAVGPSLRTGTLVAVPVHGEGAALVLRDKRAEAITSSHVEFLIMLADQVGLLLGRAHAVTVRGGAAAQARIAELAGRFRGPRAELEARVVESLRLAVEGHQPHLAGSGERVGRLAVSIADGLGLDTAARDQLYVAALLRDLGQLGMDRSIFERARSLRDGEIEVMHQHPVLGETILASLEFLEPAARIVRAHHERWDGTGYPDAASGEAILIGARILAVADAFHAITSPRPYRTAFPREDAIRTIIEASGRAFDPDVVDAFARTITVAQPARTP